MYNQSPPSVSPLDNDDSASSGEDDDEKRTLFCANLDQRVTEEILFEVFLQAGPLETVHIPKDNKGRQKTFGFVTFVHKCSVPFAVRLFSGLSLYNRPITIKARQSSSQSKMNEQNIPACLHDNSVPDLPFTLPTFDENPFRRDISPPSGYDWNNRSHHSTPYSREQRDSSGYSGRHYRPRRSEMRQRHI